MTKYEKQIAVENMYDKHKAREYVIRDIDESREIGQAVFKCVKSLKNYYLHTNYGYAAKNERIQLFMEHNDYVTELLYSIMAVVMVQRRSMTFTSLAGMTCHSVRGDMHVLDKVKCVSEIMAYMHMSGLLVIELAEITDSGMMEVYPTYVCSEETLGNIRNTRYLPPMLVPPQKLTNNKSSGYITREGSLILKSGNHHNGNICLDSLNQFNSIAFSLDTEYLKHVTELPKDASVVDTEEKQERFDTTLAEIDEIHRYLIAEGNEFYLTNNTDKRGRTYCHGHHVNYQGNPYRKAPLNFKHKELITGV